jgi:hypothetical protein
MHVWDEHQKQSECKNNSTKVNAIAKGGTQKLPQKFKIVEIYWHDHSLERSWGALSDGTISFSIQPFSGGQYIFWIFLKKRQSLKKKVLQYFKHPMHDTYLLSY